ncbi:hypothetical protein QUA00_34925 [Microcoleus sp. T2B6]|uniref:hypothetical protein n=1 Tax=Microcoleus sp. T2B6 TaxID=3055424 RepID=UPI002FD5BF83
MQSRITSHRKKEEGRRFGSGFCNGCNGWMLKEEGRRKKEEGRRKAQSSAHVSAIKNVIIVGRGCYRR